MKLFTYSDYTELREKLLSKSASFFWAKMKLSSKQRAKEHWNSGEISPTNWWNIPAVRERWSQKITGNKSQSYVDYFIQKYLDKTDACTMLSIGCGTGTQELLFAKTGKFQKIDAFDLAPANIDFAKQRDSSLPINFFQSDFDKFDTQEKYDVILFYSSLHHLKNIPLALSKVEKWMKQDGFLVIHEYTGPDRIDWNKTQLQKVNELLRNIPKDSRKYYASGKVKQKQTAPGMMRMLVSDPSEAVESSKILSELEKRFKPLEIKGYGGNVLVPLLKGISHHYIKPNETNETLLKHFFEEEDLFLKENRDDYHFAVYTKTS